MAESYQQMLHDVEAVVQDSTPHGVQHDDDHHAPERTYMQGILDHNQVATWERRDIDAPALVKWMSGLFIVVMVVMLILVGMFAGLMSLERSGDSKIPSPLLKQPGWEVPPGPPLYPNPGDLAARPLEPLAGPADFYVRERAVEHAAVEKAGLRDPKTGLAVIPEAVMEKVLAGSKSAQAAAEGDTFPPMEMPTDSSGGLRTTDRLR